MTPLSLRSTPSAPPVVSHTHDSECDVRGCGENFRLRQEYIDRLADFNAVAARHRLVLRAGVQGAGFENSWRAFRERAASSRAAWTRYRDHVDSHGCSRA